jgi:hypothetical protein
MKNALLVALLTFLAASFQSSVVAAAVSSDPTSSQITPYALVSLGPNQKIWQSTATTTNLLQGRTAVTSKSYTELATGMSRFGNGTWVETTPTVDPVDGGAAATNTCHQIFFAVNANTAGGLQLTMPDGKTLSSHVLCLSYMDRSSGGNVAIATLNDSAGEIISSNEVLYPSALQGDCTADILYENTRAGLEQNIVLKTQPPSPTVYGIAPENAVLQVWSEFLGNPSPAIVSATTNVLATDS